MTKDGFSTLGKKLSCCLFISWRYGMKVIEQPENTNRTCTFHSKAPRLVYQLPVEVPSFETSNLFIFFRYNCTNSTLCVALDIQIISHKRYMWKTDLEEPKITPQRLHFLNFRCINGKFENNWEQNELERECSEGTSLASRSMIRFCVSEVCSTDCLSGCSASGFWREK